MATERVTFAENYDHVFPNRSMLAFKAGWSGPVKAEVAERARALGVLAADAMPTERADLEKLAADEGVDVAAIEGTGSRGYVKNEDIAAAIYAKRAGTVGEIHHDETQPGAVIGSGEIHHDETQPGAVIGSGGPSGAEAPTE